MQARGTYTLGIEVLAELRDLANRRFLETQTAILRHLVKRLYGSGVGRIMTWRGGVLTKELGSRLPMQGNTLLYLPDVRVKNGMTLNIALVIPSQGLNEGEFNRLFAINKDYIERVLETIQDEVGT